MMSQEELNNINRRSKMQDSNINNNLNQIVKESKDEIKNENKRQINEDIPEVLSNTKYTSGFLKSQIAKLMRVEFLIGNSNMVEKIGVLENVCDSYIILRSLEGDSLIYADIYDIKFITISSSLGCNNFQNYNSINMNNGLNYNMNRYY